MFDDFFALAHDLQKEGRPFATAHVVRAERPTSARPGDRAIVTADGALHGWIGGSCAQPTVVEAALAALADGRPRLVRLSPDPGADPAPAGYEELPMTCFSGGTLDVYVEPQRPQPRLLVVGDLPVAQALAHLGRALAYRVLAVASDDGAGAMAHADEVKTELGAIGEWATPWTWVVVATHGNFDEPAVAAALRTEAPYVALVASPTRAAAVAAHLQAEGLGAERHRLRSPAGLDIGARRGDEIALSILAEIVQLRRAAERREAAAAGGDTAAAAHEPAPADDVEPAAGGVAVRADAPMAAAADEGPTASDDGLETDPAPESATDPVCGMTVRVTGTTPSVDHGGLRYWFCCGGCAARFAADPESFLAEARRADR